MNRLLHVGQIPRGIWRKARQLRQRQRDAKHGTYSPVSPIASGCLNTCFRMPPIEQLRQGVRYLAERAEHHLCHRFDLLGSGWVEVRHGMRCRGLEGHRYESGPAVQPDREGCWLAERINRANLPEAMRIWQQVDADYVPIDWQLDFKSGYRWSEQTWYGDIRFGHRPGVDIKIPWELARMQHLPQLAWAHHLAAAGDSDFRTAESYAREFRNQVLDFIATNPPRFGVHWQCTMEVAIRAANWLAAYDLFRAGQARFDPAFEAIFARSLYEHGLHITHHLERQGNQRGNHYLANIVGLLFVAAYLPSSPTTEEWLTFALEELIREVAFQFHPDGTNFEASTSYHRLAAEMVVYATALVLRRNGNERQSPFPPWYAERLWRMAQFVTDITKPNGEVPQIGDNDNGRFFKLSPLYHVRTVADARTCYANLDDYHELPDEADYYDEIQGNHAHLVAAVRGLFEENVLGDVPSKEDGLETAIVRALRGDRCLEMPRDLRPPSASRSKLIGTPAVWTSWTRELAAWPEKQRRRYELSAPGSDLREGLVLCAYPDFGLYVFRSRRLYLAVRCDARAGRQPNGHAHDDQLAIELTLDGLDRMCDPGTYVYTPLPERRNQYRAMEAHSVPEAAKAARARFDQGLFRLPGRATAECLYFGPKGFLGRLQAQSPVYRRITFEAEQLVIEDYGEAEPPFTANAVHRTAMATPVALSPGYGQLYQYSLTASMSEAK